MAVPDGAFEILLSKPMFAVVRGRTLGSRVRGEEFGAQRSRRKVDGDVHMRPLVQQIGVMVHIGDLFEVDRMASCGWRNAGEAACLRL